MTLCSDLIAETRSYLQPTVRDALNTLNGNVTSGATTITLTYDVTAVTPGAMLAIDLEMLYVWQVSGQVVTVQRGMQGTTAAAHNTGAVVTVNPRFSDFNIFRALNNELDDLSSPENGLYQALTTDLTWKPQIQGYDMSGVTGLIDVLRVRYDIPGPWKTWPEIRRWQLKINMRSSDFASTAALVLYDDAWPGRDVHVIYSAPFTHFAATTDNLTVTGLPATAADIPPLGAALRLAGVREAQRNFTEAQSDPRRANEVPAGANRQAMSAYAALRTNRIKAESGRLGAQYPNRRKV